MTYKPGFNIFAKLIVVSMPSRGSSNKSLPFISVIMTFKNAWEPFSLIVVVREYFYKEERGKVFFIDIK
jgi:hypothetical protein